MAAVRGLVGGAAAPSSTSTRASWRVLLVALFATVLAIGGAPSPASAAPVYEITGTWIEPPEQMRSGEPVVADWRVNVNDDVQPPSNDPVENVTVTFTIGNGEFAEIPDACLTEGVDPVSSISDDGLALVCNLGTVTMGTAVAVQTPVIADGPTGSELTLGGEIAGQQVPLPPIPIVNPFLMDVDVTNATTWVKYDDATTSVSVDFPWTIYLGRNSDPGPADITIPVTLTSSNGDPFGIGPDARTDLGPGCQPRPTDNTTAHPFSVGHEGDPQRVAPYVGSCTLVAVDAAAGRYEIRITGIDYSRTQVPTEGANGSALPKDRDAVATGTVWFEVDTAQVGSLALQVDDGLTWNAPTGQVSADDEANNYVTKPWTFPGSWHHAWSGANRGAYWGDNLFRAAGTESQQTTANSYGILAQRYQDAMFGNCAALDTRYVTYVQATAWNFYAGYRGGITFEYYTGNGQGGNMNPASPSYDPDQFDCSGTAGWTTEEPADLASVRAVRITYTGADFTGDWPTAGSGGYSAVELYTRTRINEDVPPGQDVWTFGSALRPDAQGNSEWVGPGTGNVVTPTPGARYPHTNGRRDVLRVTAISPAIEKSVSQATVVPGEPVEYTLTYTANGAGSILPEVDGYQIVDTLPPGMHYEPGSASPEPAVTPAPTGDVLTWTLDGVTTNTEHTLTYQAVADSSVEPGDQLTNTAVSRYGDQESPPAEVTVTTSSNGYTTILKTSDVEFIPNRNGDGVGEGSWTVTIESRDPYPQAFTDTIDILPYDGDLRGTSFSGTYELGDVVLHDGGTVYYTTADPETLTYDPADPSNGAAGDPTGNTVGWTTTRPADATDITAIRVIGGELAPGGSFSFQIPITTNGAEPQDVYVNSAQARAEHTTLVMRTSAALVVTDYVVVKTSDPEDGSSVRPGHVITYTITVTQQGPVPAGAVLTDTLADILDDADYNDDITADIGTVTVTGDLIEWEGTIPVGGTATITYSVTVKDVPGLQADGNTFLENGVTSPGCVSAEDCVVEHRVGWYTVSKTSDPTPGETVGIGDVVTYHVQISQVGEGDVEGAVISDDLTEVLDDATWNGDAEASAGEVSYAEPHLTWTGDLAPGDVVDLTYSVTVTGEGDWVLANVVIPDCVEGDEDCVPPPPGTCVPAPDENPGCVTEHPIGDYQVSKTSDPESGSAVGIGDVVTYTVTVWHIGVADVAAELTDDLTDVLDDATWNDDAEASAGELSYSEPTLSWSGELSQGEEVTITYSVTVVVDGDLTLRNNVDVPNEEYRCVPVEGQDEACATEHYKGAFTYSKTSDPEPGSEVGEGERVTYTVTVAQTGPGAVDGASVVDDISQVLPVATWNDDAQASSGEVTRVGEEVRWSGDLEVGQVVTITYSVTVGDRENAELRNVVTSEDPRGTCVDAADGNPDCRTEHHTPGGSLASTGASLGLGAAGLLLALLGSLAVIARRRSLTTA